jgi:hypothetical protein
MHAKRIHSRLWPRSAAMALRLGSGQALALPLVIVLAMLLSACGDSGGVDNGGNNGGGIPTATVDEFSTWTATRLSDDQAEPLDVDGLSPPTSDTTEPLVL